MISIVVNVMNNDCTNSKIITTIVTVTISIKHEMSFTTMTKTAITVLRMDSVLWITSRLVHD